MTKFELKAFLGDMWNSSEEMRQDVQHLIEVLMVEGKVSNKDYDKLYEIEVLLHAVSSKLEEIIKG